MSGTDNKFQGDRTQFNSVDVNGPIRGLKEQSCHYYAEPFAQAAKRAEEAGENQIAATYRFLSLLTSFHPNFDAPSEPYVPWFEFEGRRALIPSDLSRDDVLALRELAPLAQIPALRARMFDLVWELSKDHTACIQAVTAYVEAAESLDTFEHWIHASECFQRALQLAAKLGRSKESYKFASESIQKAARGAAADTEKFRCAKYLRLILDAQCGDAAEFAQIAGAFASRANAAGDAYQARPYWNLEAEFQKAAKNTVAEKAARIAAAETFVELARQRVEGNAPSAMGAASLLANGIEALRQAGGSRERVEELRKLLAKYQEDSLSEMKTFSTEIDISGGIAAAREHVNTSDFQQALFRYALGHPLTDLDDLRKTVIDQTKETPLTHLLGATMVDDKGRATAHKPGLLNLKGEELEEQIEKEMFSTASRFMWSLRVSSYIEPARQQIFNDHHPTYEDLRFIVATNPFIPPGHQNIFLRGIHAGFNGDFLLSSHLLVPQIENSLRYVLESSGVDVSNLMSNGTQPVKVLGALFGMKEIKEIFGDSLCFELRGCLIEKDGYDFRNRVAHGFVSEAECYSPAAITVWWLVLRICLLPVFLMANHPKTEVGTNKPD